MKSIFPASLIAASLLMAAALAGQTPESGPPQSAPPPTVERKITKTVPDVPEDPADGWSFGAVYWLTRGPAGLFGGNQSPDPAAQTLLLPQVKNQTPEFRITAPAGKYNRLEIYGFQNTSSFSSTAAKDLNFFGNSFPTGDALQSQYRIRSVKVLWDYLMYPAPPAAKVRYKLLLGMQYVGARATINAPLDPLSTPTTGTRNLFLPSLGLGMDIVPSSHFRLEVRGSGFGLPGHSYVVDGDATAVIRVSRVEILGGGRYFRFRTSPNSDQYIRATLYGPYVGVRWLFGK